MEPGLDVKTEEETDLVHMLVRLPGNPVTSHESLNLSEPQSPCQYVGRAGIIVRTKSSRCSLVVQQVLIGHLVCARHWGSICQQNRKKPHPTPGLVHAGREAYCVLVQLIHSNPLVRCYYCTHFTGGEKGSQEYLSPTSIFVGKSGTWIRL